MLDFSREMALLCRDIVAHVPALGHIDMDRVAIAFAQTRKPGPHGRQATLTPLRFEGGRDTTVRSGREVRIQPVVIDGRQMLYVITFYLPRFLDGTQRQKLRTVVHELYHIADAFDGDVRRVGGRRYVHSRMRRRYDQMVDQLVDQYLSHDPDLGRWTLLECSLEQLQSRFGGVVGRRIRRPRLVPTQSEPTT